MYSTVIRSVAAAAAVWAAPALTLAPAAGAATSAPALPVATADSSAVAATSPAATPLLTGLPGSVAGPAGQPVATQDQAGYVASGRDFRYAQAMITVPDQPCVAGPGEPQIYVALAGPDGYTRVGITCVGAVTGPMRHAGHVGQARHALGLRPARDGSGQWTAFAEISENSQPSPVTQEFQFADVSPGDGVLASVSLDPTGSAVHPSVTLADGTTYNETGSVAGTAYTQAQALVDWTISEPAAAPAHGTASGLAGVPATSQKCRVTQFLRGQFTTLSGQRGTFTGPWTPTAWEVTTNGFTPPAGTLLAWPSYLWTDGSSRNGRFGDAFGVWLAASSTPPGTPSRVC